MMRRTVIVGALLLAACGDLPRPFERFGSLNDSPLLRMADSPQVLVEKPKFAPPAFALAWPEHLAFGLREANIPAATQSHLRAGHVLSTWAENLIDQGGLPVDVALHWSLSAHDGQKVVEGVQHLGGSWRSPRAEDPKVTEALAKEVVKRVGAALQEPAEQVTAARPKRPAIFVRGVSGAPGNGNGALVQALRNLLRQYGADAAPDEASAAFVVEGKVETKPPAAGRQEIQVTWRVFRSGEGVELANIGQRNRVPAGSLDGAWGELAFAVASGGVEGIAEILAKAGETRLNR